MLPRPLPSARRPTPRPDGPSVAAGRGAPASVVLLAAVLVIVGALTLGAAPLRSDDMDVPVERQVPLLLRVLSFDRSLAGSSPLVIAVVYQGRYRYSQQARDAFTAAIGAQPATVQGRPVRVVSVEASDPASLARSLERSRAEVAYVAPLRGLDAGALARRAAQAGILTVTGVRAYVSAGVGVGVGLRDSRPEILLNRRAASAAGADLSSRLLQLATLVDG